MLRRTSHRTRRLAKEILGQLEGKYAPGFLEHLYALLAQPAADRPLAEQVRGLSAEWNYDPDEVLADLIPASER
jgi:hypothetical protein